MLLNESDSKRREEGLFVSRVELGKGKASPAISADMRQVMRPLSGGDAVKRIAIRILKGL